MRFRVAHAAAIVLQLVLLHARTADACETTADCKGGRVCQAGECVDPAAPAAPAGCARDTDCKGDLVCESGKCVSPPPAAAAPAAPPPKAPASPPDQTTSAVDSTAPTRAPGAAFGTGLIVVPKLGIMLTGSVDVEAEDKYSGNTSLDDDTDSIEGDDKSQFMVGLDLLYAVSPGLRVGGGLAYTPSWKMEAEGETFKGGSQMALVGIVEPIFPVSPTVALAVRGQGGLTMLFAGGDLKDSIDELKDACDAAKEAGADCEVSGSPRLGWTLGGGGGVIGNLGSVRLRGDVLFEYISQNLFKVEEKSPSGDASHEGKLSVSGTRLWLLAGVEF